MAFLISSSTGNLNSGVWAREMNLGGNHNISTGDIPVDGATTMTIFGWAAKQANTDTVVVGSKGTSTTAQFYMVYTDGVIKCKVANGGDTFGTFTRANDTNWHFYAMVYNGAGATNADRLKLYVDGTEQTLSYTGTIPSTLHSDSNPYTIGLYYPSGSAVYNNSRMKYCGVASNAIDSTNITNLYNSGNGRVNAGAYCTLIAGWQLNEGSGSVAYDYAPSVNASATGFNGTISGSWVELGPSEATATFSKVASTGGLDSEGGTSAVTTSQLQSSTFVPGVITVDGVAIKIATVSSTPSGTLTVTLRNTTDAVDVDSVTINVSDLYYNSATTTVRGWAFFKFGTNRTLLSGKSYAIRLVASVTSQVTCYTNGTANNWTRQLRLTTKQMPAVGDNLLILGEYTGQGTSNTITITADDLSPKAYGTLSTATGVTVAGKGVMVAPTSGALKYYYSFKGLFYLDQSGEVDLGTTSSRVDSGTQFLMPIAGSTNVDSGFLRRNGSTFKSGGAIKTFKTTLTANAAASATSVTVADATGWAIGDELAFAPTSRTATQYEKRTISNISGTTITLSSGLTHAHSGTSPAICTVLNLTRNIRIYGTSSTVQGYIYDEAYITKDASYTEYYFMGSGTTGKRGLNVDTINSSGNIALEEGSSFHDFSVASSTGLTTSGTANNYTFKDCVWYGLAGGCSITATTGTNYRFENCSVIGTSSGNAWTSVDANGYYDLYASGAASSGITINEANALPATWGNLTSHSNAGNNLFLTNVKNITMGTITNWRAASNGLSMSPVNGMRIEAINSFGNTSNNIIFSTGSGDIVVNGGYSNGDTSFSTTTGIAFSTNASFANIFFNNFNSSTASGILTAHTNDLSVSNNAFVSIYLNNSILAASTEVANASKMSFGSIIASTNHDQTVGNYKYWRTTGIGTIDTTIYSTASPSERMTPSSASVKTRTGSKKITIDASATRTITVKVRKSNTSAGDASTYNGNEVRLIMKANPSVGSSFDDDIVCDSTTSAANGSFETLTYTTPTATNAGVLEFYLDGDGTVGWFNNDDWVVE